MVSEIKEEDEDQPKFKDTLSDQERQDLLKKVTIEDNLKMTKATPTISGLTVYLEREINIETYKKLIELENASHQNKELDEQTYVYLRPSEMSLVFTRGLIIK